MSQDDFLEALQKHWPRVFYGDEDRADNFVFGLWKRKTSRFSDHELERIFDALLDQCIHPPKLSHLWSAADSIGARAIRPKRPENPFPVEQGEPCDTCDGWGMVHQVQEQYADSEGREKFRVLRVKPFTESRAPGELRTNVYEVLYRCTCPEGARHSPGVPRLPLETVHVF